MFELNQMHIQTKEQTSLAYKIVRISLMFLGAIIMFYYLLGIVSYVQSGPSTTLMDDLTAEFVVQVIIMGLALFFMILAWFRHIVHGTIAFGFALLYAAYMSYLAGVFTMDFLSIAMAVDSAGFVILGLAKRYRKNRDYNVYADPIVDELEGPDIFNFKV